MWFGWVGMVWYGWRWIGMSGDGLGWGFGISWMGEDGCLHGCWERQLSPKTGFVYLPALFVFSILGVFGWVLGAPGLRSGSDCAPWPQIDVLGVTFGASRPDFG